MTISEKIFSSIFSTSSADNTRALAACMARFVVGGEIIFLRGPIGAGKTVFVQGLASALGMKSRPVSASFSLARMYKSRKARLYHVDLFRLDEMDMANLGFEEMLYDETSVIVAEWPDPAAAIFPEDRIEMEIKLLSGDGREITAVARGPRSAEILKKVAESWKTN